MLMVWLIDFQLHYSVSVPERSSIYFQEEPPDLDDECIPDLGPGRDCGIHFGYKISIPNWSIYRGRAASKGLVSLACVCLLICAQPCNLVRIKAGQQGMDLSLRSLIS